MTIVGLRTIGMEVAKGARVRDERDGARRTRTGRVRDPSIACQAEHLDEALSGCGILGCQPGVAATQK